MVKHIAKLTICSFNLCSKLICISKGKLLTKRLTFALKSSSQSTLKKEEIGVHIKKLNKIKNKSKNK